MIRNWEFQFFLSAFEIVSHNRLLAGHAVPNGAMVYGVAVLATAAAGLLARSKRASKVMVRNYGGFKPVVGDRQGQGMLDLFNVIHLWS